MSKPEFTARLSKAIKVVNIVAVILGVTGVLISGYLLAQPEVRFAVFNAQDVKQAMSARSTYDGQFHLDLKGLGQNQ